MDTGEKLFRLDGANKFEPWTAPRPGQKWALLAAEGAARVSLVWEYLVYANGLFLSLHFYFAQVLQLGLNC